MAYPAYIREKARQLRREKKMTIDEIAECLAISRTTIFYWVGDVQIPQTQARTAAQLRAARANGEKHRQLREAAYNEALIDYVRLIEEPGFRDFICMYIGEGYKRSRNTVQIGNSDPDVVKLSDYWIRRLSRRDVTYSVQYHADQDPNELKRFWATELGVDPGQIKSSGSRTATDSKDGSGAPSTECCRSAHQTHTSEQSYKRGWIASRTSG